MLFTNQKKASAYRVLVYPVAGPKGATEAEALENIQDAIREYLAAIDDLVRGQDVREVRVAL